MEREHAPMEQEPSSIPGPGDPHWEQTREWFRNLSLEEQREVIERTKGAGPAEEPQWPPKKEPLVTPLPGSTETYHGVPQQQPEKGKVEPPTNVSVEQTWRINGEERKILSIDREKGIAILGLTAKEEAARQQRIKDSGQAGVSAAKAVPLEQLKKLGKLVS